jgi:small subunit ribosomal protein S17
MPRRTEIGVVMTDKTSKTRRVEIPRLVRHATYGKILRRRTICYVHDENNESQVGDTVEIEEARPTSKMKRWRLLRVIERSREIDMAALKAARATAEAEANLGQQ